METVLHENVSCTNSILIWREKILVKFLTEQDITAMHAELAAVRERVHKPIMVREIETSHRLDQMHHLRLLEKLAAWSRNNGFDRSEVLAERQRRTRGRVFLVDNPKHSEIEVHFEPRRPPSLREVIEGMWAVVNRLREETLSPQPPLQYDFPP